MTGAAITKQRAAIRTARERIMMVDGFICAEMQQEGKCASTECFGRKKRLDGNFGRPLRSLCYSSLI
jgi:hypothetical protein